MVLVILLTIKHTKYAMQLLTIYTIQCTIRESMKIAKDNNLIIFYFFFMDYYHIIPLMARFWFFMENCEKIMVFSFISCKCNYKYHKSRKNSFFTWSNNLTFFNTFNATVKKKERKLWSIAREKTIIQNNEKRVASNSVLYFMSLTLAKKERSKFSIFYYYYRYIIRKNKKI